MQIGLAVTVRDFTHDLADDPLRDQHAGLYVAGVAQEDAAQFNFGESPVARALRVAQHVQNGIGVIARHRQAVVIRRGDRPQQFRTARAVFLGGTGPDRGVVIFAVEGSDVIILRGSLGDRLLESGDLRRGGRGKDQRRDHQGQPRD